MRTYPIKDDHDRLVAFEVPNAYFSIGAITRLLSATPRVSEVRRRRPFERPNDIHVEFQYDGSPYMVWEPYGDSSRYWIGPKDGVVTGTDVTAIHDTFQRHRPSVLRRLLGAALYVFSMDWVPQPKRRS